MKYDAGEYDVAVIGAGHAGCEAALACSRMGLKTLIFSILNFPQTTWIKLNLWIREKVYFLAIAM